MHCRNSQRIVIAFVLFVAAVSAAQHTPCARRSMFVTVYDENTKQNVNGLSASSFRFRLNGNSPTGLTVSAAGIPKHAVIVLDSSGSMEEVWNLARAVAEELLLTIPAESEVSFIAFANAERVKRTRADSRSLMTKAIRDIHLNPTSETPLRDVMHEAMQLMGEVEPGDLMFVISDGGDTLSRITDKNLRSELLVAGIRVCSIVLTHSHPRTVEERIGPAWLREISEQTGGFSVLAGYFDAPTPVAELKQLEPARFGARELPAIVTRHSYHLEFDAPPLQKPGRLQLRALDIPGIKNPVVLYPRRLLPCTVTKSSHAPPPA